MDETFTTIALVCNDVMGTISFGPPLMPNSIESRVKCTQLFPLARKEPTENRRRSKFGTMRTSSSLSVPRCLLCFFIGMCIVPILLQSTVEPSARKMVLCVGCMCLQSLEKGVI